ncbi:hypothetical protein NDU88_007043 [Pleurodeles waltl]|uniref:Uncharacterized protein n=1 Tax=Pleurodeles waltl TaxID=8319 RepID=A0AAV7NTU2_PLEWA|nr:hypothetical protein NDU88_007043 [Pleurodeles waltl]
MEGCESSLSLILQSKKQLEENVHIENRSTFLDSRKLKAAVKKVNKTCSDICEWIVAVEECSGLLKSEVVAIKAQQGSQESWITDVMWKLEEFENRQLRNNPCLLRIAEGAESTDIHSFMLTLLKGVFPELTQWDRDSELQRVHRFPMTIKKQ